MKRSLFKSKSIRTIILVLVFVVLPLSINQLNSRMSTSRRVANVDDESSLSHIEERDLSEATPEEFQKAFKYQTLKNAVMTQSTAGPGVNLGLFFMKNNQGQKVYVCSEYPTVDLLFSADGMATSGEIPLMIVRAPCLANNDQQHIEGLAIPFDDILKSSPETTMFTAQFPGSQEQGRIFFRHITDSWPTKWTWTGVKFYGKNPEETLNINGYEIISVLGEPLVISAPPNE